MSAQDEVIGRALDLAGLIEYQPGAVVSRTLTDKPAGTITLFAFDADQGLSEHSAPFDAFVYAADGEVEVVISGKTHELEKGQMIIMPANEPHSLRAVSPFKMLLVMIRSAQQGAA